MELIHSDRKAGGPAVGNLVDEIESMEIEAGQARPKIWSADQRGLDGEPAEEEMTAPTDQHVDALRSTLKERERLLRTEQASCAKHE